MLLLISKGLIMQILEHLLYPSSTVHNLIISTTQDNRHHILHKGWGLLNIMGLLILRKQDYLNNTFSKH